jgi:hypothetical protein
MSKAIQAVREVPAKSTNVRASLWLTRAALAVIAWTATSLAARWAESLFFTPPRPRKSRVVLPAGAERQDVETRYGRVAAWSWGSGPVVYLVHGRAGWG